MKKKLLTLFFVLGISSMVNPQEIALKNNIVYDATTTPNLSLEIGLKKKTTLDLYGGFNPFTFENNKKFKHWLFQPELRFWTCERFNGTFFGIHAHVGQFNFGGITLPFNMFPDVKTHRYEGNLYGGGVSIGHQWIFNKRLGLEASIGGGYAYGHYDKYLCPQCGERIGTYNKNYWGITRVTLSLIYVIR
nr:DUF3575 domain-containing protein [uncultured Bacteroides sp.]